MRAWAIAAVILAGALRAAAACGGGGDGTVRDWGLHLAWRVERDCAHPERPPVLVAVPWTSPEVRERSGPSMEKGAEKAATRPSPAVRNGMRVTVVGASENAALHLAGTSLGTARTGEEVAVRIAVSGAVRSGVVRGPGLIELVARKDGK
jgi:Chaperone for flagella basal body P-ring formation